MLNRHITLRAEGPIEGSVRRVTRKYSDTEKGPQCTIVKMEEKRVGAAGPARPDTQLVAKNLYLCSSKYDAK